MTRGVLHICDLTVDEYKAAIAAIKLVRGNEIKNAFMEGYRDGWCECRGQYRGERIEGDAAAWENSQAKMLYESKGGSE